MTPVGPPVCPSGKIDHGAVLFQDGRAARGAIWRCLGVRFWAIPTRMDSRRGDLGHGESTGPELAEPGATTGGPDPRGPVQPIRSDGSADQRAGADPGG